ncbi:MAG: hypothetical protein JNJ71_15260 [Rubrivivax sp.]|nr:hypothetical protein [Rubrivivax sp.]
MMLSGKTIRSALVLACMAPLAWGALAQTSAPAPSAASPSTEAPATALPKEESQPLVAADKLKYLESRHARKTRQSNPARPDKPQEAINWFVGKRTGPMETRGPNANARPAPLDVMRYPAAIQAAKQTPLYVSATRQLMPGNTRVDVAAAAPGGALGTWQNLGPSNQGGRTRQLLVDPTNPSILYAAAVGGGVWKSVNAGNSWTPLTDLLLPNIAVASLAMDPKNPQVLYAGTGEGFFNGDAIRGMGIFKTTDGGASWSALSATTPATGPAIGDFSYVNQIVVSPRDSRRLYAATRTGLFRSNDGGASWTRLIDGSTVRGCMDIAVQAKRALGFVFATCGTFAQSTIYRALDSGSSSFASVYTEAGMGRTSLAIAPSNENVIYALAANASSSGMHAVFRSTTGGASGSWTARVRSSDPNKLNRLQLTNPVYAYPECVGSLAANFNQGWYDNVIAVDPLDSNRVWTGGIDLMRSDDGGANWGIASYWWFNQGDANYAHADQHAIRFHPGYNGTTNKIMYVANDGGIFRTDDARANVGTTVTNVCGFPTNGMVSWTELNTGYTTTQYYHGAVWPDGQTFMGGMQDNGTWRGTTATTVGTKLLGGDGGYVSVDTKGDANPANDVLFSGYTGLSLQRSINGGGSFSGATSGIAGDSGFAFIAPHEMNAGNRQRMFTGGWYIWRTVNQASSWARASEVTDGQGSVSAIASSPLNANRVLVGMTDGYIHYSSSALTTTSATIWASARPVQAFVSSMAFDPNNEQVAYVAYSFFPTLGQATVLKTSDGGATWSLLPGTGANVLPAVPATAIVVDPSDSQRIYVGTDIGVYTTVDGGQNWYREVTSFGHVSIDALAINATDPKYLYAFTHGRGAWRVQINP